MSSLSERDRLYRERFTALLGEISPISDTQIDPITNEQVQLTTVEQDRAAYNLLTQINGWLNDNGYSEVDIVDFRLVCSRDDDTGGLSCTPLTEIIAGGQNDPENMDLSQVDRSMAGRYLKLHEYLTRSNYDVAQNMWSAKYSGQSIIDEETGEETLNPSISGVSTDRDAQILSRRLIIRKIRTPRTCSSSGSAELVTGMVSGVGVGTIESLNELGIITVDDLLLYLQESPTNLPQQLRKVIKKSGIDNVFDQLERSRNIQNTQCTIEDDPSADYSLWIGTEDEPGIKFADVEGLDHPSDPLQERIDQSEIIVPRSKYERVISRNGTKGARKYMNAELAKHVISGEREITE